jgi:hypothetical protein
MPGDADIDKEILPPQNRLVAVHDSMGFEPGKPETFAKAESFLRSRTEPEVPLKDHVHVIWCVVGLAYRPYSD